MIHDRPEVAGFRAKLKPFRSLRENTQRFRVKSMGWALIRAGNYGVPTRVKR